MKEGIGLKRLSTLFITLLLVFSGCGAKEPTAVVIDRSFSCPVSVEQNGLRYEAVLTVTPEQCTAVFSLPDEMQGFTMTCRNGCVTLRYGENKTETPLPEPEQCFLFRLTQALAQPNAAVMEKENTCVLRGVVDGTNYLLTIDKATRRPLYFEMDLLDLTVKFKDHE